MWRCIFAEDYVKSSLFRLYFNRARRQPHFGLGVPAQRQDVSEVSPTAAKLIAGGECFRTAALRSEVVKHLETHVDRSPDGDAGYPTAHGQSGTPSSRMTISPSVPRRLRSNHHGCFDQPTL